MKVRNNCYVRLWDYTNKETLEYRIIEQSMKTHYIGGDVYEGRYYMKSEQVLASGGDGLETISLNSKLGEAINGKSLGDTVSYTRDDGVKERFKIIGVSYDGVDWEEVQILEADIPAVVCESNSDEQSIRDYESKRLKLINNTTQAWKLHCEQADRLVKELRSLRRKIAIEDKVLPYFVFQDKSLVGLCENLPVTGSQLLTVHGFGETKVNKYGDRIIDVIKKYIDSIDLDEVVEKVENSQLDTNKDKILIVMKECITCQYTTADPRFVFCPICGKNLAKKGD